MKSDLARFFIESSESSAVELTSEGLLTYLLTAGPAIIFVCDSGPESYRTTFISSNVHAQLGYEPEQIMGDPGFWADHIHPDDRQSAFASLAELRTRARRIYQYRFRHQDGSYRWIHEESRLVGGTGDEATKVIGSRVDITAHRQTEEALDKSKKWFELCMHHMPGAVFIKDTQGRYVYANPVCEASQRVGPGDWKGKTDDELFPAESARQFRITDSEVLRIGKAVKTMESVIWSDDVTHWLVSKFPIPGERNSDPLICGVGFDITQLKRAEDALRAGEQRLRGLLEERERLSRNLHDHIIQAIYAIGMKLEECQRQSHTEIASQLAQVIDSLNRVMHDAREYIAGSRRRVVNGRGFRAELAKLEDTIGPRAKPRFRFHISKRAIDLTPDEAEHLLQIAREALSNSVRHSQAQTGKLVLRLTRGGIELEVSDNGVGFDPEQVKRGSGGLRNMETRARQIGAKLEIRSSPGNGTQVIVHASKSKNT